MLQKNKAWQILRKKNVPHPYIRIFLTVSGGEKCLFFGKFVVFCFLVTAVLRFAILFYYRRTVVWNSLERIFLEKSSLQMLKLFLNFKLYESRYMVSKAKTAYNKIRVLVRSMTLFSANVVLYHWKSTIMPWMRCFC